jgi:signal transduction histidine kinase
MTPEISNPDLERDVRSLKAGDHLCLFYEEDLGERLLTLVPFIRQGLDQGERVLYVADDQSPEQLPASLSLHDVNVEAAMVRGAFCIWSRDQWLQPGPLDPQKKAGQVRAIIDEALSQGFRGIRMAVEMTRVLGPTVEAEDLWRWESTLNDILDPAQPVRLICLYSKSRLSPEALEASLATHPIAVLGDQLCANAFYRSDHATFGSLQAADARGRVDWMVSQLKWVKDFEAEREGRLQAEAALARTQAEQRRMRELYELAQSTAESLAAANDVKDEFLGLVSHELRTPLTIILGNSHVLLTNPGITTTVRDQALMDIKTGAEKLDRLVANLLDLARAASPAGGPLHVIALPPIIQASVEEHKLTFPCRTINLEGLESAGQIAGNEVFMEHILANLLSNAEKYSPAQSDIDIVLRQEGDWQVVEVRDRGIGLKGMDHEHIFDAFYRSDRVSKVAGLGIGLTVCKRLIEAQGGRIWARPRAGGGSEFCFMLRRVRPNMTETDAPA